MLSIFHFCKMNSLVFTTLAETSTRAARSYVPGAGSTARKFTVLLVNGST